MGQEALSTIVSYPTTKVRDLVLLLQGDRTNLLKLNRKDPFFNLHWDDNEIVLARQCLHISFVNHKSAKVF